MALVNLGQLIVASTPSLQTAGIVSGVCSNLFSMFAGFMINPADIPSFWQFVYWLNPLHYAFQGLVFTQFHGDTTLVSNDECI
jgi:ABC-type multidrug transport system permease subunit